MGWKSSFFFFAKTKTLAQILDDLPITSLFKKKKLRDKQHIICPLINKRK